MGNYRKRVADGILKDNLEAAGLVLIEGTKWCGKTTTAEQRAGGARRCAGIFTPETATH